MSLDTLISHNTMSPDMPAYGADTCALVLMGGGARTAYQVGVLKAIGAMLAQQTASNGATQPFPFQWLFGTSAG
ncbi:MAG: patatin, partial [Hydrogenophaga sp.]|nr:patatin [Hydrogenophaga sp.]